jgi:uncharacterized protein with GYD domain
MPRYLIQAAYTETGLQGILKEGGSKRAEVIGRNLYRLGGSVEAVYFALGETDVYIIVNLPDNVSAAAFSIATNASGVVKAKTTVLLTPEEIDEATEVSTRTLHEQA